MCQTPGSGHKGGFLSFFSIQGGLPFENRRSFLPVVMHTTFFLDKLRSGDGRNAFWSSPGGPPPAQTLVSLPLEKCALETFSRRFSVAPLGLPKFRHVPPRPSGTICSVVSQCWFPSKFASSCPGSETTFSSPFLTLEQTYPPTQ